MEFFESIKPLLGGYHVIGLAIVAALGVLGKGLGMLGQAAELHDKNFVRKRLERLDNLRLGVPDDRPIANYLDSAIEREKFRIASGISVSPAKMNWLMQLDATGLWSREQIRAVSKFLVTDTQTGVTEIELTSFEKIGAGLSIIGALALLLMGAGYFMALALKYDVLGFLAGCGVFCAFIFVARLFSTDFINYRAARKFLTYLKHNPEVTSNSD